MGAGDRQGWMWKKTTGTEEGLKPPTPPLWLWWWTKRLPAKLEELRRASLLKKCPPPLPHLQKGGQLCPLLGFSPVRPALVGPFAYRHIKKEVCSLSHAVDGHLSQQLWKVNLHSQNPARVTHTSCKVKKKKKSIQFSESQTTEYR